MFVAIASPVRRALLDTLSAGPRPVRDLAAEFSISRPAVSQHLRILREASLVSEERFGRERRYQLNPSPAARSRAVAHPLRGILARPAERPARRAGGTAVTDAIRTDSFFPHPPRRSGGRSPSPDLLASWLMPNDFEPRVGHQFTFTDRSRARPRLRRDRPLRGPRAGAGQHGCASAGPAAASTPRSPGTSSPRGAAPGCC